MDVGESNFFLFRASLHKTRSTNLIARRNLNHADEQALLDRLQKGEREVFGELYERYKRPLFAYCYRLLSDRHKAEDAEHEAFLKAYASLDGLKHASLFRVWLFRIARNEVYGHLRKHSNRHHEDANAVWIGETPLDTLVALERRELVRNALRSLKDEYREVVVLREYEGFSYSEIAEIMGDTESSVKSRLFKARKALIKKLEPFFGKE